MRARVRSRDAFLTDPHFALKRYRAPPASSSRGRTDKGEARIRAKAASMTAAEAEKLRATKPPRAGAEAEAAKLNLDALNELCHTTAHGTGGLVALPDSRKLTTEQLLKVSEISFAIREATAAGGTELWERVAELARAMGHEVGGAAPQPAQAQAQAALSEQQPSPKRAGADAGEASPSKQPRRGEAAAAQEPPDGGSEAAGVDADAVSAPAPPSPAGGGKRKGVGGAGGGGKKACTAAAAAQLPEEEGQKEQALDADEGDGGEQPAAADGELAALVSQLQAALDATPLDEAAAVAAVEGLTRSGVTKDELKRADALKLIGKIIGKKSAVRTNAPKLAACADTLHKKLI